MAISVAETNDMLAEFFPFSHATQKVDFIYHHFGRKTEKRGKSREKETNLQRKRKISKKKFFSKRDFISRENSLFTFLSTSNASTTSSNISKSANTSNASIFMFVYIFSRRFREKFMKREFSLKKSLLEKCSFFIWDFSLSLENSLFFSRFLSLSKFSPKICSMKPS